PVMNRLADLGFKMFTCCSQAGPLITVKIPKDKEGKTKQFAFVNYKHEESVHYGKDLLNGIPLFGRALNIQFRSGSVHDSREGNQAPNSNVGSYSNQFNNNRGMDKAHTIQRSFSSPDSLQRQAIMNNFRQQSRGISSYQLGGLQANLTVRLPQQQPNRAASNQPAGLPNYTIPAPSRFVTTQTQWNLEMHRHKTQPLPYQQDNSYYTQEGFQESSSDQRYRGNRESEYRHNKTWEYDPRREHSSSERRRANWH
uniref:RRM domain-containing protein n=1 Tax=Callorhinchus milii TaxID=7868 RepID=A0A4W3HBL1_CALMI